jgi:cell division protein FtsB
MASSAQARRPAEAPRRREELERPPLRVAARPAPQARRRAARQLGLTKAFIIFVICLSVLAAGRVTLSFAVVQKSVATESVAREQRQLTAENALLAEQLATLGSTVHIRNIAEKELGLVDAAHVQYLWAAKGGAAEASARP